MSYKRRALGLVAIAIGLVVVLRFSGRAPVEVEVAYRLGARAQALRELSAEFRRLPDDVLIRRVLTRYPGGAPSEVRYPVRLAPGRYRIRVELQGASGSVNTLERGCEVTGGGQTVYLDLATP
jgi:hypothetical protein